MIYESLLILASSTMFAMAYKFYVNNKRLEQAYGVLRNSCRRMDEAIADLEYKQKEMETVKR